MQSVIFPSSLLVSMSRPLDDKTNVLTTTARNAIPMQQRYKGMMLTVQNAATERSRIFWLPSSDLSNAGWEEIEIGADTTMLLLPNWAAATNYIASQLIFHDGNLFRCNETHTASAFFEEDANYWDSLGGTISDANENEIAVFDNDGKVAGAGAAITVENIRPEDGWTDWGGFPETNSVPRQESIQGLRFSFEGDRIMFEATDPETGRVARFKFGDEAMAFFYDRARQFMSGNSMIQMAQDARQTMSDNAHFQMNQSSHLHLTGHSRMQSHDFSELLLTHMAKLLMYNDARLHFFGGLLEIIPDMVVPWERSHAVRSDTGIRINNQAHQHMTERAQIVTRGFDPNRNRPLSEAPSRRGALMPADDGAMISMWDNAYLCMAGERDTHANDPAFPWESQTAAHPLWDWNRPRIGVLNRAKLQMSGNANVDIVNNAHMMMAGDNTRVEIFSNSIYSPQQHHTRLFMESWDADCNVFFYAGTRFDTKNTTFYARDGILHLAESTPVHTHPDWRYRRVLTTDDLTAFAGLLDDSGATKGMVEAFQAYCETVFSEADREQMLKDIAQAEKDREMSDLHEDAIRENQYRDFLKFQEEWKIKSEKREIEFRKQQEEHLANEKSRIEKENEEYRKFLLELQIKEQEAHRARTAEIYQELNAMVDKRVNEILNAQT